MAYEENEILGRAMPDELAVDEKHNFPSGFIKKKPVEDFYGKKLPPTRQAVRIATCNDNTEITDEVREARLKKLFATIGIEVEFTDV